MYEPLNLGTGKWTLVFEIIENSLNLWTAQSLLPLSFIVPLFKSILLPTRFLFFLSKYITIRSLLITKACDSIRQGSCSLFLIFHVKYSTSVYTYPSHITNWVLDSFLCFPCGLKKHMASNLKGLATVCSIFYSCCINYCMSQQIKSIVYLAIRMPSSINHDIFLWCQFLKTSILLFIFILCALEVSLHVYLCEGVKLLEQEVKTVMTAMWVLGMETWSSGCAPVS